METKMTETFFLHPWLQGVRSVNVDELFEIQADSEALPAKTPSPRKANPAETPHTSSQETLIASKYPQKGKSLGYNINISV